MQFKKKGEENLHETLTNICKICECLRISEENPRKCKNLVNLIVIFAAKVKKSGETGEGWGEIFIMLLPKTNIFLEAIHLKS